MAPRLLACFGRGVAAAPDDATGEGQLEAPPAGPVLVELFGSQGCGASPEADAVAARLAQDSGSGDGAVVVLAFHVDYWDYRGWKDPFASSAWTVRQKAYVEALRLDTLFTPQVVLQGRAHCVGTDQDALALAVRDAPRYPAPAIKVRTYVCCVKLHTSCTNCLANCSANLRTKTKKNPGYSKCCCCRASHDRHYYAYAGSATNSDSDLP
jgi:hypothetical protein